MTPPRTAESTMQSLLRGLKVIEQLADASGPTQVGELSQRVDLPKSTVQRILYALAEAGWVDKADGTVTRWVLSPRIGGVIHANSLTTALKAAARPHIERLGRTTGETIHLAVFNGTADLELVDRVDSTFAIRVYNEIGVMGPIHACAAGKAVLASLDDAEVERFLAGSLERRTDRTITDPDTLWEQVHEIRDIGFSTNIGENRDHVCAVASAILDGSGTPCGAITISIPDSRYQPGRRSEWGEHVRVAAAAASESLASRDRSPAS